MHTEDDEEGAKAACGQGVHADLEKDIAHPSSADGEEGAEGEMNRNAGNVRQVAEHIPGPPVKKHGDYKTDNPVLHIVHLNAADEFQPPGNENDHGGIKNGEQQRADHPEQLRVRIHADKGGRVQIHEKGDHIGADEQRVKDKGDKVCCSTERFGGAWLCRTGIDRYRS